ncbi:MAG: hypothetical protein V4515_12700 [Chloroflexota bacterium]
MSKRSNKALTAIRAVVWIFMIGAAAISARHIVHVSQMLGLGWESYTVPAFIDGIAIVGKVSMLVDFSHPFRKSGFRLLMFGGTLSLAANVFAGSNWGQRGFGVLIVAGFMILESHATKADRTAIAEPEVEPVEIEAPAPVKVRVTEAEKAARKRAGYDGKSRADKAAWSKAYRARIARQQEATAPTSPGRVPVAAPAAAELDALVR